DAKVRAVDIQVQVGSVADWRGIVGAMPGRAYPKGFTEHGQFFGWRQTPDVADMDPYKIDQTIGNEGHPFLWIGEELAHGDGSSDLLAKHLEPHVLLWWQ